MNSATENEKSPEPPSPKRPKLDETPSDGIDLDSDDLEEDLQLFYKEWSKSEGFDVDFSKLRRTFDFKAVDLDDCGLADEPDTNRDFLNTLAKMAISYYKEKTKTETSLEFVKVLRANFHPSGGITFYITFEANDPCDGNQTKLYRTVVRYMPGDTKVRSCMPRPC